MTSIQKNPSKDTNDYYMDTSLRLVWNSFPCQRPGAWREAWASPQRAGDAAGIQDRALFVYIHSFIYSFDSYLLSTYYVPGTGDSVWKKTKSLSW